MAINPIRVLPRFSPAPLSSGSDVRSGERVMLEIIQHELLSQRQKQAEIDNINQSFSTMLAKDQATGLNPAIPYQKRALDKINAITQETSSRMQAAKDDPYKMRRAEQEYAMQINNDPDIIGARREAATLEKLYEHTTRLREKGYVNDDKLKMVLGEINNPDRVGPVTFDNLDLGSLSKDIYDIGKEILDDRQTKESVIERDENGRIVAERTIETLMIPGKTEAESKEIHKKYLEERLKADFPERSAAELRAVAHNRVEDRFLKNRGQDYSSVKSTPVGKAVPKTYQEKQAQKLDEGGIEIKDGPYGRVERVDGQVVLYDRANQAFSAEEKWDELAPGQKQILKDAGVDYDRYQVAGSNRKISGSGLSGIPMGDNGLAGADKAYNKANGVTTVAEISEDGYLDTNNPAVLDKVGIVLKYDKKSGKYTATDKSGKALKDGDFIVTGGAKDEVEWFSKYDEGSTGLNFRVRVSEIKKGDNAVGQAGPGTPTPGSSNPPATDEQSVEINGYVFKKTKDGYEYTSNSDKEFTGTVEEVNKAWEKKYGKGNQGTPPPDKTKSPVDTTKNVPPIDTTPKQASVRDTTPEVADDPWKFKKKADSTGTKFNYGDEPEVKPTPPPQTKTKGSVKRERPSPIEMNEDWYGKKDTIPAPVNKPTAPPKTQTKGPVKRDRPSPIEMDEDWYGKEIPKPTIKKASVLPEINQSTLPERHVKGNKQSEDQWREVNNESNTNFEVKFSEVEKNKGVKITYDSADVKDSIEKGYFSNHAASAIVDLADLAKSRKVNELRITGYIHHITRDNKKPHNFDLGMNPAKDSMRGMFIDKNGKHTELLPETQSWLKKHGYALVIENDSYSDLFDKSSIYGNLESGSLYFRPEAKRNGVSRGPHYSFEYVGTAKTKK